LALEYFAFICTIYGVMEGNMAYKIAVASSDGKVVNQHFGHSRQFVVYDVNDADEWNFKEIRVTNPICSMGEHSEASMQQVVALLSDCKVVVVSQIGFVAEQALLNEGIRSYSIPDFIDAAILKVTKSINVVGIK
jgi:nitrogen fixation protein NifX